MLDRRAVALAGHTGDVATAEQGLGARRSTRAGDRDRRCSTVSACSATSAWRRCSPTPTPPSATAPCELAAKRPGVDLRVPLADPEASVAEVAAWACGEHEAVPDDVLVTLVELAGGHGSGGDPLVREAAVAALGAIGDDRGLDAILTAYD